MIKGNHDYWWGSLKKISEILPPSIHLIQNNAFHWRGVAIGGARLWDTPEYSFGKFVEFRENPRAKQPVENVEAAVQEELSQKIFDRELERLKSSLKQMNPDAKIRIAMTHYPPIGNDLQPSRAAQILRAKPDSNLRLRPSSQYQSRLLSFRRSQGCAVHIDLLRLYPPPADRSVVKKRPRLCTIFCEQIQRKRFANFSFFREIHSRRRYL